MISMEHTPAQSHRELSAASFLHLPFPSGFRPSPVLKPALSRASPINTPSQNRVYTNARDPSALPISQICPRTRLASSPRSCSSRGAADPTTFLAPEDALSPPDSPPAASPAFVDARLLQISPTAGLGFWTPPEPLSSSLGLWKHGCDLSPRWNLMSSLLLPGTVSSARAIRLGAFECAGCLRKACSGGKGRGRPRTRLEGPPVGRSVSSWLATQTSLVHLIVKGSAIAHPPQTVGCTVSVKHVTYGKSGSSSNSIKDDAEREFFVELWDVSGHERYKDCRSIFYKQINGVIFVHDLSQRRTKTGLSKWAVEVAATGTFSAPLRSGGPGGLPVPYLVISNKVDISAKEGTRSSSGNLVDAARQWVEKQGLLPSSEDLPLTESFPASGSLLAAAKEARFDKEAIMKFFRTLIRRRYFSDELPAPNPWSMTPVQNSVHRSSEISSDEDQSLKIMSINGEAYQYNALAPLPAQRNLPPPPTLYPQQPMSVPADTYSFNRFSMTSTPEITGTRTRRTDINV
ncbi:hypothetical protein Taro_007966 [Colocasia esculenta]|uniref:Uncharacterized protein n=1 Tax=Colocasia esculenta TaxID=4460 RepID=A0A843TSK3_COLES|nr:hypothetical protein [Colocasia esculenta]